MTGNLAFGPTVVDKSMLIQPKVANHNSYELKPCLILQRTFGKVRVQEEYIIETGPVPQQTYAVILNSKASAVGWRFDVCQK